MGETDRNPMDVFTDDDIEVPASLSAFAVVVVSDGAWETISSDANRPVAHAIAAVSDVDARDAHDIAHRIMTAARSTGLDDNATVAAACVSGDAQRHVLLEI